MNIELTNEQKQKFAEIYRKHVQNGLSENDAAQITLMAICLFPDTPLEQISTFVDTSSEGTECGE